MPKCSGPFKVTKALGNDRYEIVDTPITRKEGGSSNKGIYSVDKSYPWLVLNNDVISSDSNNNENL